MQIEGRKLIFIMNFSVLDFSKFASRMPHIAQILVSTFRFSRGACPRAPIDISSFFFFFFFFSNFRLCITAHVFVLLDFCVSVFPDLLVLYFTVGMFQGHLKVLLHHKM